MVKSLSFEAMPNIVTDTQLGLQEHTHLRLLMSFKPQTASCQSLVTINVSFQCRIGAFSHLCLSQFQEVLVIKLEKPVGFAQMSKTVFIFLQLKEKQSR